MVQYHVACVSIVDRYAHVRRYKSTRQETNNFGSGDEGAGRLVFFFVDFFKTFFSFIPVLCGVEGRESMTLMKNNVRGGGFPSILVVVVDLVASLRNVVTSVVGVIVHVWRCAR